MTTKVAKIPEVIRVIKQLYYRDFAGRHTSLEIGCKGYVLDEENIPEIFDISQGQVDRCLVALKEARESNKKLAIVAGYVCALSDDEFEISEPPKMLPIPWELIYGGV